MKINPFLSICLAMALVGCSSDDETTTIPEESDSNYFPLTVENSWTYQNESTVEGETPTQGEETLIVADSTQESGTTYYNLNSDNTMEGGLVTGIFANGTLVKINDELVYNGTYQVNLPQVGSVELPINDAIVFSRTADAGTELYTFTHSVEQDIEVEGQIVPITINYTLTTTNEGFLPTYSAGGEEFEDVLQANLKVVASVTATIGPAEVDLLDEQEVLTIANYYANDLGLIFSDVLVNYEFEDLSNFGIPQIPPIHIESSQEIDSYTVILE